MSFKYIRRGAFVAGLLFASATPHCLLLFCLLPLTLENQAQKSSTSVTRHSTALESRVEMPLRDGWRFKLGPESATELQAEPDATWTTVSVPHTWNRVGYYKDAPASHINTAQNVVTAQGVGWYKLVFTPPANVADMESFLQFDAASRIATVWLNGTLLGTHRGGFSRFRFDSTAALEPGHENALTVKVDNTKPALGSSTADVLPLTGDFFVYGGLYRPVSLVFTPVRRVPRYAQDGCVRAFEPEASDDWQDFEVCNRFGSDQIDVFVVRILVVDNSSYAPHIGAHHKSQGDCRNIVVLSCVLGQQVGFAMEDVETTIEQRAETRCRPIRIRRARVASFKSFQEADSPRGFVETSEHITAIEVVKTGGRKSETSCRRRAGVREGRYEGTGLPLPVEALRMANSSDRGKKHCKQAPDPACTLCRLRVANEVSKNEEECHRDLLVDAT